MGTYNKSPELLFVIALPTVIAYGLGRAFRYVLSGSSRG